VHHTPAGRRERAFLAYLQSGLRWGDEEQTAIFIGTEEDGIIL
jgi:hypothetical protein